jgi:hypothetical protein
MKTAVTSAIVQAMADEVIRSEVEKLLAKDQLLLGSIFRAMRDGKTNALELVTITGASNRGVIYNYQKMLHAILDGVMPNSASISRNAGRAISRLIKESDSISQNTLHYLNSLRAMLLDNSETEATVLQDQKSLEIQSEQLAKIAAKITNGIYVYSFPTYLHFGTIEDQDVVWLKIGSTKNSVWQRIVEQNRQTSMPEDPKLLRIYHKADLNLDEVEKNFHLTLEAVGHERSSARRTKAGKEWFATTLEAVDAISRLMNLEIEKYEVLDEIF